MEFLHLLWLFAGRRSPDPCGYQNTAHRALRGLAGYASVLNLSINSLNGLVDSTNTLKKANAFSII
jgi:hypothetical protein